jgi:hypothetical protein
VTVVVNIVRISLPSFQWLIRNEAIHNHFMQLPLKSRRKSSLLSFVLIPLVLT